MSSEEKKAIVRRFVAAADQLDFEKARTYLSPAIVVHLAGVPGSLDLQTFVQFGQTWHAAFPDEQTKFEAQYVDGDVVVSRMTSSATHAGSFQGIPPTGKQIQVSGIWIDRIEDGKIVERWGVIDMLSVLQQLGLVPAM